VTTFYLVRHGQIDANVNRLWHGSTDSPLNQTGITQAEKMASKIFEKLQEILHKEQELVEGKVSGYFTPIVDEKTAGEIFRAITGIVYVEGEIGS
jgi:hypothetical protein